MFKCQAIKQISQKRLAVTLDKWVKSIKYGYKHQTNRHDTNTSTFIKYWQNDINLM
jgi:hypothetical protein